MAKRWIRRLGYATLGLVAGAGVVVWWSPWEFVLFPEEPPKEAPTPFRAGEMIKKGTRVAVVTAHPDDAEFYMGGTLPQIRDVGAKLSLVVVTDGDKGYYPFEDSARNRRVRREEQTAAAKAWGAREVRYLGFPDGRVQSGERLNAAVRDALLALKPEIVLSFDDRYSPTRHHADHSRAGEAVAAVIDQIPSVRGYGRFATRGPNRIVDVTKTWPEKLTLMKMHASQFVEKRSGPVNALFGRNSDNPFTFIQALVERSASAEGARIGVKFGEGLRWTER